MNKVVYIHNGGTGTGELFIDGDLVSGVKKIALYANDKEDLVMNVTRDVMQPPGTLSISKEFVDSITHGQSVPDYSKMPEDLKVLQFNIGIVLHYVKLYGADVSQWKSGVLFEFSNEHNLFTEAMNNNKLHNEMYQKYTSSLNMR